MNKGTHRKRLTRRTGLQLGGAVKISISMPASLAADALKRQEALRLSTFSDYIQHATRKEIGI